MVCKSYAIKNYKKKNINYVFWDKMTKEWRICMRISYLEIFYNEKWKIHKISTTKYLILSNLTASCVNERSSSILFGVWDRVWGSGIGGRGSGSVVRYLIWGSGIWFGVRRSMSGVGVGMWDFATSSNNNF